MGHPWFGAFGWPNGLVYLALPGVAAVLVATHGAQRFRDDDVPAILKILDWVLSFGAYMTLLTDQLPFGENQPIVRVTVEPPAPAAPRKDPTVGSALLRIVTSIPAAIVVAVLQLASGVLWILAAIGVLIVQRYPRSWFDFQCAVLRAEARLLVWHASATDEYPPLGLEFGPTPHPAH
jgi:hypothetical protein